MSVYERLVKTIFRLLSLRSASVFCFVILIFLFGCGKNNVVDDTSGISVKDLPGAEYGTVIMNGSGKISLLGWIHFGDINGDEITGQWIFETWGEQPYFTTFPSNTSGYFPDAGYVSEFNGQVFGDKVIISLPVPDSNDSIGIILDTQDGTELRGSVTLLPDKKFKGSIKALKKQAE